MLSILETGPRCSCRKRKTERRSGACSFTAAELLAAVLIRSWTRLVHYRRSYPWLVLSRDLSPAGSSLSFVSHAFATRAPLGLINKRVAPCQRVPNDRYTRCVSRYANTFEMRTNTIEKKIDTPCIDPINGIRVYLFRGSQPSPSTCAFLLRNWIEIARCV